MCPAWSNSLFEDNAEFGYGYSLAFAQRRDKLADTIKGVMDSGIAPELKDAFGAWLEGMNDTKASREAGDKIKELIGAAIESACCPDLKGQLLEIQEAGDLFTKKSIWIFGGDRLWDWYFGILRFGTGGVGF